MSSLSEQAYEALKHKIIALELAPGATIDETALQEELEMGRTPIREALKRLEQEKLVNIMPRRGMFVTDIKITDLQQLFELRLVLEGMAARLAAQRGTAVHWDRMAAALYGLPTQSQDNARLIAVDEICHQIIYEAADNQFLHDTCRTHYTLSLRLWYFFLAKIGDMQTAVLEHQQILDALQAGEAVEAADLMGHHIRAFQSEIQSVMMGAVPEAG